MNNSISLDTPIGQNEVHSIPDMQCNTPTIQLLMAIDEFQRALPPARPSVDQMAEIISRQLDESPRTPMQLMTERLAAALGISPREVSKIARSIGFDVVAVRDGQRVFKTLQRGDAVQRRLAHRKAKAASRAGRLAS
jgi:hypothetical protein